MSVVDCAHLGCVIVIEGHAHPVKVHAMAADAISLVGSRKDERLHLLVHDRVVLPWPTVPWRTEDQMRTLLRQVLACNLAIYQMIM